MKRPALPFVFLVLVALAALFVPTLGSTAAPAQPPGPINSGDVAWMLTASALVLLMTPGLSFFYGGMVSFKNVVSTMLQSVVALGVISLLWVVVGFSLAFGDSIDGLIGNPLTFFMFDGVGGATHPALSPTIPLLLFALFQLKFAIITPALITGSFAERVRFSSYLLFIVPLQPVHLRAAGALDVAPGGLPAQVGRARLRGRHGRPHVGRLRGAGGRDAAGPPQESRSEGSAHAGQHPVRAARHRACSGSAGSDSTPGSALAANETAALAFATTNTASAAAMLAWIFFDWLRGNKPSAMGACIGAVVGLVAITPAAGYVTHPRQHHHRRRGRGDQQPGRQPAHEVGARRHARRLPLPRHRRHDRHGRHRHLRHERRPDHGQHDGLHVSPARPRHRRRLRLRRLAPPLQARRPPDPAPRRRATKKNVGLDLSQHGEIAAVATNGGSKKAPLWGLERTA